MSLQFQKIAITIILLASVAAAFIPIHINITYLHYTIAIVFILTSLSGIFYHWNRINTFGYTDYIAWSHIVIFALLLFLSTKAIIHHSKKHHLNTKKLIATSVNGDTYDLTDFANSHPGGKVIWKTNNKNIEDVWKEHNVMWHLQNDNVKKVLEKYKL